MTLEKIVTPNIEIELFGKKHKCEMKLRNYSVLRERCNVTENELLKGLLKGNPKYIVYAIWATTLKFAEFDETDPLKLEEELPLKDLFSLTLQELNIVGNQVVAAIQAALPEPSEKEKSIKKKTTKTKKKQSMK